LEPGRKVLSQISSETGGAQFEVSNQDPIEGIYSAIEEELRNQYSLGYTPDQSSPGFHKLAVRVMRKDDKVQTRARYAK
jgi:hypothetical protein